MSRQSATQAAADEPGSRSSMTSRELVLLACLTGLAAVPRLWRLGDPGLWLDEAVSHHFARLSPGALLEALRLDSGPPLYYLLLGFWQRLVGGGELGLRSFSVLAGLALVPALFWAGSGWASAALGSGRERAPSLDPRAVGWWAAVLAAVAPLHVAVSREARVYALVALVALLAAETWRRWLGGSVAADHGARPGTRRRTRRLPTAYRCYFVLAAVLVYLHNYGLFVLAGLLVASVLTAGSLATRARRAALTCAPLLLYLAWLPTLLAQLRLDAPTAWMGQVWNENGVVGSLWASAQALGPGGRRPIYAGFAPLGERPGLDTLAAVCGLLILGLGLWALWRRRDERSARSGGAVPALWPAVLVAVPLLAALTLSLFGKAVYLPGRLEVLVLPFVCLLGAVGLAALRAVAVRYAGAAVWVLLATLSLAGSLAALDRPTGEPGEDRELGRAVVAEAAPGDTVIATSLTYAGLAHALREAPAGPRLMAFPAEQALHPGNEDLAGMDGRLPAIRREARELVASLDGRVVLALVPNPAGVELIQALAGDPRRPRSREVGDYRLGRLGLPVKVLVIDLGGGPGRSR